MRTTPDLRTVHFVPDFVFSKVKSRAEGNFAISNALGRADRNSEGAGRDCADFRSSAFDCNPP